MPYGYSNNGFSMRAIDATMPLLDGEVTFKTQPTEDDLLAAFPARAALLAAEARARAQLALTGALEKHYDATAQAKHYDNRLTCALRAGYPGPFQAEGLAFGTWMDTCNALGYQVIADIEAGLRSIPTEEELVAEMPAMVWPEA